MCLPLVNAARGSTALFKVTATFQLNLCNCFSSIYEHKLKLIRTPLSQNSSGHQVYAHDGAAVGTVASKVRGSNPGRGPFSVEFAGPPRCLCGFSPGTPASSHRPKTCPLFTPTTLNLTVGVSARAAGRFVSTAAFP